MTGDPAITPFEKFKEAIDNIRDRETANWNDYQEQLRQRRTIEKDFNDYKITHPDLPPQPPTTGTYPDLRPIVTQAKTILYSPNFFWVKLSKLRELLPK